jgi:hypothetical protein
VNSSGVTGSGSMNDTFGIDGAGLQPSKIGTAVFLGRCPRLVWSGPLALRIGGSIDVMGLQPCAAFLFFRVRISRTVGDRSVRNSSGV